MGYGGPMKNFPPQIHWGKEHEERACKCYNENRKDVVELMEVLPSGCQKKHTLELQLMESLLSVSHGAT